MKAAEPGRGKGVQGKESVEERGCRRKRVQEKGGEKERGCRAKGAGERQAGTMLPIASAWHVRLHMLADPSPLREVYVLKPRSGSQSGACALHLPGDAWDLAGGP